VIATIPPYRWDDLRGAIATLYETHGQDHYGEGVSQLEHASQAAQLAIDAGARPTLIAAAFLHDIGHLLDKGADPSSAGDSDRYHERIGAGWIAKRFGDAMAAPIGAHVEAKRYLCAIEPGYEATLSEASRHSLALQGGPMGEAEAQAFADQPGAADAVMLRRWDDAAKVPGALPITVEQFLGLI